jgi:hypothetical protein
VIVGYADGDHVLLDEFSEVNAGIEAARDDIHTTVIRGHIEHNFGVISCKLTTRGQGPWKQQDAA